MDTAIHSILALAGRADAPDDVAPWLHLLRLLQKSAGCAVLVFGDLPEEPGRNALRVCAWESVAQRLPALRDAESFPRLFDHPLPQVVHLLGARQDRAADRILRRLPAPRMLSPSPQTFHPAATRRLQKKCRVVAATSRCMREALRQRAGVADERIVVIPPGIAASEDDVTPPLATQCVPVIAAAGALTPPEHHDLFLLAARNVLDAGRDARFLLGGDGPAEHRLRREAQRLNLDHHLTFVTDLLSYRPVIAAADLFVRPAVSGLCGYAPLDAMALGRPVVACESDGVREWMEDGCRGIVIAPPTPEGLSAEILALLDHPAEARRVGAAGHAFVTEHLAPTRSAAELLALYGELVASSSPERQRP